MWRDVIVVVVVAACVAGCGESKSKQRDSHPRRELTLNDIDNLPAGLSEAVTKWDGLLHRRIPEPAKSALEQAEELELFSLDPFERTGADSERRGSLAERKSLGKVRISDKKARDLLLAAWNESLVDEMDGEELVAADCFDPRHKIRIERDGKTYDFVICFDCSLVYVFVDGSAKPAFQFETWSAVQPVFDAFLTSAGVPLGPKSPGETNE